MVTTISKNFFLFLFTITFLLMNSCEEQPKQLNKKTQEEEVLAPENIISLEEAKDIYDNYSKHRVSIIENYETLERSPSKEFQAARFVDFDYDTIKNYIDFVDQEAKKAGVKKVTKLRLYFANYPNKKKFKNGKKVVHPKQNSLFILPTLEKGDRNYSFYIGDDGKAKLVIDRTNNIENGISSNRDNLIKAEASILPSFTLNSSLRSSQSLTLNFGNGGPPPATEF